MTASQPAPYWKQLIDSWSGLLAFVYIEGYLVANSHFARVEFTKTELLSGRYLSAGIILLAVCIVPLALSFLAATLLFYRGYQPFQWLKALGSVAVAALVYALVISRITLPGAHPWDPSYRRFSLFLLGTGVILALFVLVLKAQEEPTSAPPWVQVSLQRVRRFVGSDVTRRSDTGRRISLAVFGVLSLLILAYDASRFGAMVYPSIYPEYGGGAVHLVNVRLTEEAGSEAKTVVADKLMPRIDQDGNFVYVIACGEGSEPDQVYALQLSHVEVVSMKVTANNERAVVNVPGYIRRKCGRA